MHKDTQLTVVINFYNNEREALRSLYSLRADYQQNVDSSDYKVIAIDNGSPKPINKDMVTQMGDNFEYHYFKPSHPSPCEAMNFGVKKAETPYVMSIIDGAHILSPGLIFNTLAALKAYSNPVVLTLPLHLGPYMQYYSVSEGYNQEVEDELLASVAWKENGYHLFSISNINNYERGFFSQLYESNCFTAKKEELLKIGGFNEAFKSPGGGLVNLDIFQKLTGDKNLETVTLIGEATFHQFHGGVTTNAMKKKQPLPIFKKEYADIYGMNFSGLHYSSKYIGEVNPAVANHVPDSRWESYTKVVNQLGRLGQDDAAIEVLKLAKELNPYRIQFYIRLGSILLRNGKLEQAKNNFEMAIKISPANEIDQYLGLAGVYLKKNDLPKAREVLQQASILDNSTPAIPLLLFQYFTEKKKPEQAKKQLAICEKLLLQTRKHQPHLYIKTARGLKDTRQPKRAKRVLEASLAWRPELSNANFQYGLLLKSMGETQEAEQALLKAITTGNGRNFRHYDNLADLYLTDNQLLKALKYSLVVRRINPTKKNQNRIKNIKSTLKQKRLEDKNQSFIYSHIPKSGGMSVRKYLLEMAVESGIEKEKIWTPGLNNIDVISNIQTLGTLNAQMPSNILVLADHSYFDVHNTYNIKSLENPFYFTILREPYARFVSCYYYFYFSRAEGGLKNIHLNDLNEQQFQEVLLEQSNMNIRYIGNFDEATVPSDKMTQEHLDIATENLFNKYNAFGIFERMGDSIELLSAKMPSWLLPRQQLPFNNQGRVSADKMTIKPEMMEQIKKYNALDTKLYQLAIETFGKRYKIIGR